MSDDESQHDPLQTEGGEISAANGSETLEDDQSGSTFMDCSINSTDTNSRRGTTGRSGQELQAGPTELQAGPQPPPEISVTTVPGGDTAP